MSRDKNGRFLKGNPLASKGGQARAEKLPAWRRKEIAQKGFQAMVVKHFNGDRGKATRWLAATGRHALDGMARENDWFFQFPDPGPHPAHRQQKSEEFPDSWY
jgi:hypothetical protein